MKKLYQDMKISLKLLPGEMLLKMTQRLHLTVFFPNNWGCFPEVEVKPKVSSSIQSPWMTSGMRISSKNKNKLFSKKLKKSNPNKHNAI